MAITDWSSDPNANTSIGGINIAEECPAANLNNAIREMMAQISTWLQNTGYQPFSTRLDNFSDLVGANNNLPIFNGPESYELAALTPFMRLLFLAADGPAVCNSIGAVRVASVRFANPGHIRLLLAGQPFQIGFGTATANGNGGTNVLYPDQFPSTSFAIVSGTGELTPSAQDNPPVVTNSDAFGFTMYNASEACTVRYLAVGY